MDASNCLWASNYCFGCRIYEYFNGKLFGLGTQWRIPLAVITVIAIGVMNLFENKVGAIFSIITTAGKMIPIAAIIIFGLFWGHQDAFGQTVTEIHQSTGGFGVAV